MSRKRPREPGAEDAWRVFRDFYRLYRENHDRILLPNHTPPVGLLEPNVARYLASLRRNGMSDQEVQRREHALRSTRFVQFDEFYAQLRATVHDALHTPALETATTLSFCIPIDEDEPEEDWLHKSNTWVTCLVLRILEEDNLWTEDLFRKCRMCTQLWNDPNHVQWYCDDMAYSGNQLVRSIAPGSTRVPNAVLIAPFLSQSAHRRLTNHHHLQVLPSTVIVPSELELGQPSVTGSKARIVFQHKLADDVSTFRTWYLSSIYKSAEHPRECLPMPLIGPCNESDLQPLYRENDVCGDQRLSFHVDFDQPCLNAFYKSINYRFQRLPELHRLATKGGRRRRKTQRHRRRRRRRTPRTRVVRTNQSNHARRRPLD